MRQILHRSFLLMVLYAAVAMLFILCFSTIYEFYTIKKENPDFLSNQHVRVSIINRELNVTVTDLVEFTKENTENAIIYRDYPWSRGKSVLLNGVTNFKPNIIEGRSFKQQDFENSTQTVVIEESLQEQCIEKGGVKYFLHQSNLYEVIGIFQLNERETSRAYSSYYDNNSLYYVNMAADFDNIDYHLEGEYIFDLQEKSMSFYSGFYEHMTEIDSSLEIRGEPYQGDATDHLLASLRQSSFIILIFIITVCLVLLNVFSITRHWVEGRKKEVAVRLLSGGNKFYIKWLIIKDYILIVSFGYLAGIIIPVLIISASIIPFIGSSMPVVVIGLGYMLVVIIGIVASWIFLTRWLRQDIVMHLRS
ncbi:ABC transporter permease [Proteinivorax hydrogeniformans]|uniref:ABC transporter permease n=1 Tax=Proteinivorax hydrogeniformans TaxID=1826727 RepID=A0AAU8HQV9_9FIRM